MATTCTVPTVKAALVSGLTSALPGQQVSYGWPGDVVKRSCIYIGDVTGRFDIPTMKAGRKHRDETYAVEVYIGVVLPGKTVEAAETQAFTLLAALEDLLANNPGFVSGVNAAVAGEFDVTSGFNAEGAACAITCKVNVSNRLN